MQPQKIRETLPQFTGTTEYHAHQLFPRTGMLKLTDGAAYVRKECRANWLFDIILSVRSKWKDERMAVAKLDVDGSKGLFTLEDGNKRALYKQPILYTDFPLEAITLWIVDDVCMLPSEY